MAGDGRRFREAGYNVPKPLIHIHGRPMIQHVVENLRPLGGDFVFLVRSDHISPILIRHLKSLVSECDVIPVPDLTKGAACTVLLAEKYIENDSQVVIANSDQLVHYDLKLFQSHLEYASGSVWVFGPESHPKWSYAKLNHSGFISEVAEKKPISSWATCGVYYWKYWGDYVDCAKEMIARNIRTNNEFYVCPAYNIFIEHGLDVWPFFVEKMIGLGTPEDLKAYDESSTI